MGDPALACIVISPLALVPFLTISRLAYRNEKLSTLQSDCGCQAPDTALQPVDRNHAKLLYMTEQHTTIPVATRHGKRAMKLVCVAHFFSHFYLLLLPPLFPVLATAFNVGYTELGFALMTFSLISGFTQAPIGFLVDRVGAPRILITGIAMEGLAIALIGVMPVYSVFLAILGAAGIANSVYHPADYAILNQVVHKDSMARAFSFHTAAGLLGEAVAPATILLLAAWFGWKIALVICGLAGVIVAIALLANVSLLESDSVDTDSTTPTSNRGGIALLLTAPILMGLAFFACISMMTRGMTGFSVSALHLESGMSITTAGVLLSCWLFAAPVGVLAGGQIADRTANYSALISALFVVIAAVIAIIAMTNLPLVLTGILFAIGGFCAGAVSPSRDMLIRSMTPPGQTGKVFGFVSTGFNVGGIIAPPIYGYLLDNSNPDTVFWMAAFASLLAILTVTGTGIFRLRRSVSAS